MKLIDICVGKTQELNIGGQAMKTAYLKEAVSGPVQVNALGLAGNDVAVHTDAIYAFSQEDYSYWADRLGANSEEWSAGLFAENLLVSGFSEQELKVGDVISVGNDVQLSVSGPRIPCVKLCWRLGQPSTFIPDFALSGKSGVYFNVEKPGEISPGDKIDIIHRSKNSIAITELAEIAFGVRAVDVDRLDYILNLPGLSETSALVLRNKLYEIIDQQRMTENRWTDWRDFEAVRIVDETPQIKSFILKPVDGGPLASYRAGQFLTVNLPVEKDGDTSLIRVWSLSDYQDDPDHYRLSIKKEPQGIGSCFMHDEIQAGKQIEIQSPMGRFVLDRSSFKPVLLIAGGIGITPLLAMLKSHLARGEKAPPIYFIHCCQNRDNQSFREELDRLANEHEVPMLYVYDHPSINDVLGADYQIEGFLSIDHIHKLLEDCHIIHGGKRVDMPLVEVDIYICGPPIFQENLYEALINAGANSNRVFQESFQANTGDRHSGLFEKAEVVFSRSEKIMEWKAEENLSLLELAESAELSPPNACRMGICQSCSAIIKEGSVYYDFSLTHTPEDNQVLLCRAKPNAKRVVIDF